MFINNELKVLDTLENDFKLVALNVEIPQAQVGQMIEVAKHRFAIFNHEQQQLSFIIPPEIDLAIFSKHKIKIVGEGISDQQLLDYADGPALTVTAKAAYLASALFLVMRLRKLVGESRTFATLHILLLESEGTLPFRPVPSFIIVPDIPDGVIAGVPLLEDLTICSRIACKLGSPGCFDGSLEALEAHLKIDEPVIRFQDAG